MYIKAIFILKAISIRNVFTLDRIYHITSF